MNKADLELWGQQPETKWLLKELTRLAQESLSLPCLEMDNPYRTHSQRAYNEGKAEAFNEIYEMIKGED